MLISGFLGLITRIYDLGFFVTAVAAIMVVLIGPLFQVELVVKSGIVRNCLVEWV